MSSRRGKRNMTPEQEEMLLQIVKTGMWPSQAARKVGVTSQALSNKKRRDPDFLERFEDAEASAELALLACVLQAAKKDWRAAKFIMERRWKARWGEPEAQSRVRVETTATAASDIQAWQAAIASTPGLAALMPQPATPSASAAQPVEAKAKAPDESEADE